MASEKRPAEELKNTADGPQHGTSGAESRNAAAEAASVKPCFVVGIGASAGGQGPLEQLFTTMPPDCGISFVVAMHLPPNAPSFLSEMLGRYTTMEVVTAEEEMQLLPNRVHVIPAGRGLRVSGGRLFLEEPEAAAGAQHPIDRLFRSLADEAGKHAIAVVLSGFGLDGAEGAKRVSAAGGIVIVQDPDTALSPAMPGNIIAAGAADLVLPPEEMPAKIAEIARGECSLPSRACRVATLEDELAKIFSVVKAKTGHDFSSYKQNTVLRRIERRMAVNEAAGIARYIALLQESAHEAQALCQDILIGVTSFFRDPEAFATISGKIIPQLFADRDPDEPVRIWHACCATGEEVYSMAILIREYLAAQKLSAKVLIFATDIDEAAIAQARAGLFGEEIAGDVGEERLKAFFSRRNGRWQADKSLREMIVFAHHSLIKDPPFSKLDLLVCRNFLIYLNSDMQQRMMTLFHQVLKPGGFLFLGGSETVGRNSELFGVVDKKWKIFERQDSGRRPDMLFPFAAPARRSLGAGRPPRPAEVCEPNPGAVAEKLLMERYAPPCVVVNEKYEVVYVSTRTSRFLEVPVGEPTRDILKMSREELRPALRAAVYKAFAENRQVDFRGVGIGGDDGETEVNLLVEPLNTPQSAEKLAMVIVEPAAAPQAIPLPAGLDNALSGDETSKDMLVRQLEEQLRITHEQLQATTEQLESSNEGFMSANEELMSINEEFQSANEELQSTNEELETSKEELQALNEELVTVNAELQGKVEELNQATSDMENLLASSGIATIFLDRSMTIKGFTPAVADIFNLIPTDIGRPFRHLAGKIDWPTLAQDAETVLAGQPFTEREVASLDKERCYLKRIFPYRTQEGSIEGIVVTFIDITERKRADEALRESEERVRRKLESIISPEGDIGNLDLADIIDAPAVQSLMDDFHELNHLPMALIDLKGKVLVGVGWQDICTKFHRVNPDTCRNCIESDVQLSAGVPHGEYKLYKCKNSMWDVATPVMVGKRKFGNLFMGQFFFDDEPLDYELFRSQARKYGFDEQEYIACLEAVPRLSRATLNIAMSFFMKLAGLLSKLSYSNIKLARSLAERDALMKSLAESEERLKLFIEHAPAALAMFDDSMRYLSVSRRWLSDYGLEGRDLIGESHYDVFPEITAEWREIHRRGLAGEVVRAEADRFVRADGSVQWVRWETRPWRDAVGKIGGIVIFAEDITDIKEAEEILRRYELLARHSRDIFLFVGRDDGRILEANSAAAAAYGYCHEELLGLSINDLRAPQTADLTAAQMAESDNRGILFETVHHRKDGSTFPVEVSSQGATVNGKRTLVSVVRDISKRKAAEEALRASEERLKRAQEIAHLGSWELDLVNNVLTWSDEVFRIFGLQPQEFNATYEAFLEVLHPDDRAGVDAAYAGSLREGRDSYEIVHRIVRKSSGEVRFVQEKCEHFRDAEGRIIRSIGMVHDITERKQAEEDVRRHFEELSATNKELERFNSASVGRELRMIELKTEINELCSRSGLPERYQTDFEEG